MVELFHWREKGHMLTQVKHSRQLNPSTQCTCSSLLPPFGNF